MKNTRKLLYSVLSLGGVATLMTPIITSCSTSNLKLVSRGDGDKFAVYGNDTVLSFKDEQKKALANESGNTAFKTQLVNQLLYNWYEKLANKKNSDDKYVHPDFNDNWTKWTNDINKDYDNQVQSLKNQHGADWEYFLQNNVLDPEGSTEAAWKYNQMCKKVRDAFADLAFKNDYLAYSSNEHSSLNVDSPTNTFTKAVYQDVNSWKNVGFYAHANTNYTTDDKDDYLDDIYALIQDETFNQWSHKTHPISVAMSLWKYTAPEKGGMRGIYSDNIPNNGSSKSATNDVNDSGTETLNPTYEVPAFDPYNYEKDNVTGKYKNLIKYIMGDSTNYRLGTQGVVDFGNSDNTKQFTDDSSNFIIVTANDAFSTLDSYFAGAVAQALGQETQSTSGIVEAGYIKYPINKLLPQYDSDTDILYPFLYRSNDDRLFKNGEKITDLDKQMFNNKDYVLDISTFDHLGNKATWGNASAGNYITAGADFHSSIYNRFSDFKFDYYGNNNYKTQGGVQFAINGVQLVTQNNQKLPYFLIRDTFGVHLIAINGIGLEGTPGFLKASASDANNNTTPFSQERQNMLLKAQALYQKLPNQDTGINFAGKIKDYFKSNTDDIILAMAKNNVKRPRDKEVGSPAIFDWSEFYKVGGNNNSNRTSIYEYLDAYADFNDFKKNLTGINTANKKLFDDKFKDVQNTLIDRSEAHVTTTENKYKNALAGSFPFKFTPGTMANSSSIATLSTAGYDVTSLTGWTKPTSGADLWKGKNILTDAFATLNNKKSNLETKIDSLLANIKNEKGEDIDYDNRGTDGPLYYSEHLNIKWSEFKKDGDHGNPLFNGVYKALAAYAGGAETTTNFEKLYLMRKYSADLVGADQINAITGLVDSFKNDTDNILRDAVISKFYSSKVFGTSSPISYYKFGQNTTSNDVKSNYPNMVTNAYAQDRYLTLDVNDRSEDSINYWKFIDALAYLKKDNHKKLMEQLQRAIGSENEGDIVWFAQDNTDLNKQFNDSQLLTNIFGWKDNLNGVYDSTYMPGSSVANFKPSSYMDNSAYYAAAPMPTQNGSSVNWNDMMMGFAGLNTSTDTNSALPAKVKELLFDRTYNSKVEVTGTGTNKTVTHLGVWYKFGTIKDLYEYIKNRSGESGDLNKAIKSLAENNEDPKFIKNVQDIASRTEFVDGDPELKPDNKETFKNFKDYDKWKTGYPIPREIRVDRLLGRDINKLDQQVTNDPIYKIYKEQGPVIQGHTTHEGWGLESYKNLIGEANFNKLFQRFGSGDKGVKLLYNGDDSYDSHLIDASTSGINAQKAMAAVIQLNHQDVTETKDVNGNVTKTAEQNLLKALGADNNTSSQNSKNAMRLLELITVQYAMSSTTQTSAENDMENTLLKDEDSKFQVYDRRWNDALGSGWVKDWKSSN